MIIDPTAFNKYNIGMTENKYSLVRSFLQRKLKKKIRLSTSRSRNFIISVENQKEVMLIKIHSQFLKAPFAVLDKLVEYIQTKNKNVENELKKFIYKIPQPKKKKTPVRVEKISHIGKVYNLKVLFDMLNERYFDNSVTANITWGRTSNSKPKRSIRFGSYEEVKDIIRINPELDKSSVPKFFLGYVIYHEMLHCKLGFIKNDGKKNEIHTKKFKELEKQYFAFNKSQEWEKQNKERFFSNNSGAGT